jgi:excisionase family DNA binding protein
MKPRHMAKRPNPKRVKAARTYTIPEAAETLGLSPGTIRGWVRQGLPAMTAQRPYLILGDDLSDFMHQNRAKAKTALTPDQLFCLTCKKGRAPLGLMVDVIHQSAKTARLLGLCGTCGGISNRIVSRATLPRLAEIFDVGSTGTKGA